MDKEITISGQKVQLTNLEKIFWPDEKITKGDLIEYYADVAKYILPHLKDRPESLHRFPDGIKGEGFYQKNYEDAPNWVKQVKIHSESDNKKVNYLVCQNEADLLFLINLGCIDLNPWNSRIGHLNYPDYLIIDLDPEDVPFSKVVEVALTTKKVLDKLDIPAYLKTTGLRGMHILIPMAAKYTYEQVRNFAEVLVTLIHKEIPNITSLERNPDKRKHKVYLDYLQNSEGQTIASAYSVRPAAKAPVSTPLRWNEVTKSINPEDFTIKNIKIRLEKLGDIYKPVLEKGIDLKNILKQLKKS